MRRSCTAASASSDSANERRRASRWLALSLSTMAKDRGTATVRTAVCATHDLRVTSIRSFLGRLMRGDRTMKNFNRVNELRRPRILGFMAVLLAVAGATASGAAAVDGYGPSQPRFSPPRLKGGLLTI